jgi:hypothetical protein
VGFVNLVVEMQALLIKKLRFFTKLVGIECLLKLAPPLSELRSDISPLGEKKHFSYGFRLKLVKSISASIF